MCAHVCVCPCVCTYIHILYISHMEWTANVHPHLRASVYVCIYRIYFPCVCVRMAELTAGAVATPQTLHPPPCTLHPSTHLPPLAGCAAVCGHARRICVRRRRGFYFSAVVSERGRRRTINNDHSLSLSPRTWR